MKKLPLLLVLLLAACAPSEQFIQTAIAGTEAARPTVTFTPTASPSPTVRPTSTRSPTKTPTPTPLPATQTARAQEARQTGTAAAKGATATAKASRATEIAQYSQIQIRELITYADSHKGEKVQLFGRVFNVNGNQELQMWVDGSNAVYVVMREPFSDIFEESGIAVYGTVAGENCGTNAYGAEVCQPLLIDALYSH